MIRNPKIETMPRDELKKLQKYIEEIQVLKADLQYFDKLYKNQTSTVKTI